VNGTLRGVFAMWLALIALQTLTGKGASGRVASAFDDVNGLLVRVLDAKVPALPDRRTTANPNPATVAPGRYNGTPDMAQPLTLSRLPVPTP
jgi:hypothetical protein